MIRKTQRLPKNSRDHPVCCAQKTKSQKKPETKRTPEKRKQKFIAMKLCLQLLRSTCLGSLAGLLGQKVLVDVGQDTTLSDGDVAEQLVQLLVVAWYGIRL
jgi:hypothetical protein